MPGSPHDFACRCCSYAGQLYRSCFRELTEKLRLYAK